MYLHFLKTVWSDIIILEEDGHFAMIDTGMAEQFPFIMEFLGSRGAKKLDFILLTHFHRDHYGSIPLLLDAMPVDRVILKEYSGLDCKTAWGSQADDAYRADEMRKYLSLQQKVREKSALLQAEDIDHLDFMGHTLYLYSTKNTVREIYEDASHPETYHRFAFSENQNSLAAWMEAEGVSVFFGGDMQDLPSTHPLADYVHTNLAKRLNRSCDIYKAPHHGTVDTASAEALAVYKPKIAVITNGIEYLTNHSDVFGLLKPHNPQILLTETQTVSLQLKDGSIK